MTSAVLAPPTPSESPRAPQPETAHGLMGWTRVAPLMPVELVLKGNENAYSRGAQGK